MLSHDIMCAAEVKSEAISNISGCRPGHTRAMPGLAWLAEMLMRVRNVCNVQCSMLNRLVVTRLIFEAVRSSR